jgi:thioredoxin reductase
MTVDVAVIGAGPYGLSIASHLRARRIEHRIFGAPMHAWRMQMPQGMFLKSEGFASSLFDPMGAYTLRAHCERHGLPYADIGMPIGRDVFSDYGVAFQRQFVPHLEQVDVTGVAPAPEGFRLTLASGETLRARRVVLAVGISHFAHLPAELAGLPAELISHSSRHADLSGFAGREMLVLGIGASAVDCAALLAGAGARVTMVGRAATIHFHEGPGDKPRSWVQKLRAPISGLGPGWKSRLCTDAPLVFHAMPEKFRRLVVDRHLGPAPGWWTRPMVEGKVEFRLGQTVESATAQGGRIRLALRDAEGRASEVGADHLIAGTGYRPDMARLHFLDPALRASLRTAAGSPVLSRHFESSVPGLYFVGLSAAMSFGPLERFVYGAGFAARRLARHFDDRKMPASARPSRVGALQVPDAGPGAGLGTAR